MLKRNFLPLILMVIFVLMFFTKDSLARDFTWKGDIRIRQENRQPNQLNRERLRLRLGFSTQVNEEIKITSRFATAGGNTSTNQTFGPNFSGYGFFIDQAYFTYQPQGTSAFTFYGGKMKNYFDSSPLLWDTDTNPDGIGQELKMGSFFLRAAEWVTQTDVAVNQGVYAYQIGYQMNNLGLFLSAYNHTSVPASFMDVLLEFDFKPFHLGIDYAQDSVPNSENSGYWVTLGWNKIKKAGDLSLQLSVADLGKNFAPPFTDSDFSGADHQGYILGAGYGLNDAAQLKATYFNRTQKSTSTKKETLQMDAVIKF